MTVNALVVTFTMVVLLKRWPDTYYLIINALLQSLGLHNGDLNSASNDPDRMISLQDGYMIKTTSGCVLISLSQPRLMGCQPQSRQ